MHVYTCMIRCVHVHDKGNVFVDLLLRGNFHKYACMHTYIPTYTQNRLPDTCCPAEPDSARQAAGAASR